MHGGRVLDEARITIATSCALQHGGTLGIGLDSGHCFLFAFRNTTVLKGFHSAARAFFAPSGFHCTLFSFEQLAGGGCGWTRKPEITAPDLVEKLRLALGQLFQRSISCSSYCHLYPATKFQRSVGYRSSLDRFVSDFQNCHGSRRG